MTAQAAPTRRPTRTPTQDRAKRTVESILQAASDHLVEHGVESFTTNTIAARAQVNIATLYSYFPDKYAILDRLLDNAEQRRREAIDAQVAAVNPGDWRASVATSLDRMAKFRLAHPDGMALRQAIVTAPELHQKEREANRALARDVAPLLRQINPNLTKANAERAAMVAVEAATELLDGACADGKIDRRQLGELRLMIIAYLEHYLD